MSHHTSPQRPCSRGRWRWLAAVALIAVGLVTRCASLSPAPAPTSTTARPTATPDATLTRIGLLVPLNGPNAAPGRALRQGVELAMIRTGARRQYQLVVEDESGAPGSAALARKLVEQDQVVVAMIGIGSAQPSAPAQIFQAAHTPVVGWYCMRDLFDGPGPSDFILVPQETFEVYCPEQASADGARIYGEDTMGWILRGLSAAGTDNPRAIRDALRRLPYR